MGGMLDVFFRNNVMVEPLVVASACPGGPIVSECYAALKSELIEGLQAALPVDGVCLSLHGAAAAEGVDDVEGEILDAVRGVVGTGIPIVASLDLHAHVTERMIDSADALIALETYPHRDAKETGQRAAGMLLNIMNGIVKPEMVMAKVPVLTSAVNASTEDQSAFADLMRIAKSCEGLDGIVSTGVFLVHPYLDAADMGSGALVIANGDAQAAQSLAVRIAAIYWQRRHEFEPRTYSPEEAISLGLQIDGKPVLLVETADCSGGGAAGDSVTGLRALLSADLKERSLACVVDPWAAAECHEAGVGGTISVLLGHRVDRAWGQPIPMTGRVLRIGDGRFVYGGGMWKGTEGQMGPSAVLECGPMHILVTSRPTYDWADEQYRALGLNPADAKFVIVKNPMNYREGYRGIMAGAFILDTPGPTPASLRDVQFSRVTGPYYPAVPDIPGLEPRIISSKTNEN